MAIGYVAEHNRLPWKRLLFSRCYPMRAEEGVEVGAVDVDLTTYLREGDEALVAVVLPRLGGDAKELAGLFGFYPFATGVIGVASGDEVDDLLQRVMEVAPFFFRHYEQQCRGGDLLRGALHSGREGSDSIYKEDRIRLIIQLSNRLTSHSTEYATAGPLNQLVTQAID